MSSALNPQRHGHLAEPSVEARPSAVASWARHDVDVALHDPVRLEALRDTNLLDTPPDEALDRLTQLAATVLEAPIALLTLLDETRQYYQSAVGLHELPSAGRQAPLSHGFCPYMLVADGPLIIADVHREDVPALRDNPFVRDSGILAYLGVPLHDRQGQVLGTLCVLDKMPRAWSIRQLAILQIMADSVMTEIERRPALREAEQQIRQLQRLAQAARATEERLRDSEERYRVWYENTPLMYFTANPEGTLVSVNPFGAEQLGYAVAELVGQSIFDLVCEADRVDIMEQFSACLRRPTDVMKWEFRKLRKDGELLWIRESVRLARGPDGSRVMLMIGEDIGEGKRAELELHRFAARLENSNRELREFATVASHDLQEPLRKIQMLSERLQTVVGGVLPDRGQDYLERIQQAASRMHHLVNDLLAFSRVTSKARPFAPVDLNIIARSVLSDLEMLIEDTGGQVELGDLPTLDADATQMQQLLQNLIANALKFHRPNETPRVTVSGTVAPAGFCRFQVEDNGIGFESQYEERIFVVFERLHGRGEYEGTGIGLAVCRKIVERHDGAITAQGTPGVGAQFTVTLPVTHAKGSTAHEKI